MSNSTSEPRRLDYSFGPVPTWIRRDVESGLLPHSDYSLVVYLYERADSIPLCDRAETPKVTLESIARAIRWPHDLPSLARQVRRLRDKNRWFTYRVEGNSRTGQLYIFMLFPDGPPSLSAPCPPVPGATCPPVGAEEPQQTSGPPPDEPPPTSARPRAAADDSRPPVTVSRPPVHGVANPLADSDSGLPSAESRPTLLEDLGTTKAHVGERATTRAGTREGHAS